MSNAIIPIPQADVNVREATADDVAFIDDLQKRHRNGVGFMHRGTLEGKIAAREVLIAEEPSPQPSPGVPGEGVRVGYAIGTDRYFKHDDVGIIYHLNVAPGKQRGFVGATLLRAMFDRAAYGCRLFCCWCAQDIEANHFWEAMGFVPLAYRAGSEKKSRVHIFWQKRIRPGDNETPWWFPSQTTGGAMNADRLVLPIPPGVHWSDAKPIVLPGEPATAEPRAVSGVERKKLTGPRVAKAPAAAAAAPKRQPISSSGGMFYAPVAPPKPACPERSRGEKKPREKTPKRKNDPRLVAAARELKDRWLEHVNAGQAGAASIESAGKYDVTRQALPESASRPALLPAA